MTLYHGKVKKIKVDLIIVIKILQLLFLGVNCKCTEKLNYKEDDYGLYNFTCRKKCFLW